MAHKKLATLRCFILISIAILGFLSVFITTVQLVEYLSRQTLPVGTLNIGNGSGEYKTSIISI